MPEFSLQEMIDMNPKQVGKREVSGLSRIDRLLAEDGVLEAFEAVAIKEVLAWQIADTMKEQNMSRNGSPSAWAPAGARLARCSIRPTAM